MPRVGFLGASSIDNAGDQIVGLATRQAIRARVASLDEVVFSIDWPQPGWRHDWTGIERIAPDATGFADELDALIIGGGGLLLPRPGFAPYRAWGSARAAWNALCSQSTPWFDPHLAPFYASVREACERLRYVSVRNHTTEHLLRRAGFAGEIHVVPDPSLAFEAPQDPRRERDRPLVGLSVGNALGDPRAQPFYRELLGELARLSAARAIDLVVFPFGRVYGDVELAKRAAAVLPHARLVGGDLTATATWQLVGQLDLHICARLHAMLAAYAQGVPFLVCDEYLVDTTGTSKIRDFVVDRDLHACYLSPWIAQQPAARLALALAQPTRAPAQLAADRARLAVHFDQLVAALGLASA